jgi:hypothetical protein
LLIANKNFPNAKKNWLKSAMFEKQPIFDKGTPKREKLSWKGNQKNHSKFVQIGQRFHQELRLEGQFQSLKLWNNSISCKNLQFLKGGKTTKKSCSKVKKT